MQYVSRNRSGENEKVILEFSPRTEIENYIDEYVHKERDRQILKRRLLDGICFEPLAEEFGLSDRQIKNIVYKYSKKIFNKCKCNI